MLFLSSFSSQCQLSTKLHIRSTIACLSILCCGFFLWFLFFSPTFFRVAIFIIWIKGPRTAGVIHCTDCFPWLHLTKPTMHIKHWVAVLGCRLKGQGLQRELFHSFGRTQPLKLFTWIRPPFVFFFFQRHSYYYICSRLSPRYFMAFSEKIKVNKSYI